MKPRQLVSVSSIDIKIGIFDGSFSAFQFWVFSYRVRQGRRGRCQGAVWHSLLITRASAHRFGPISRLSGSATPWSLFVTPGAWRINYPKNDSVWLLSKPARLGQSGPTRSGMQRRLHRGTIPSERDRQTCRQTTGTDARQTCRPGWRPSVTDGMFEVWMEHTRAGSPNR